MMAQSTWQTHLHEFTDFLQWDEPLAPYAHLRVGGPAGALARPRSAAELCALVRRCSEHNIPLRVLGDGCNVLVPDEGVAGVVLRLSEPAFTQVAVQGRQVRAGCGASLLSLIAEAARHKLAGLETLVGTPGTLGGALRHGGSNRAAELAQCLRQVEVVDSTGAVHARERDDLHFALHSNGLDDPVLLAAEFELEPENAEAIIKRMRRAWIQRKSGQPFSFQAAARAFRNPRGLSADALVQQAGLAGTRVGGAEVSEHHPSYVIAHPGATARDLLRLIDLVRSRVQERFQVELELELSVW
jgi:UDP-N-acetylmuramate dehydrogenase